MADEPRGPREPSPGVRCPTATRSSMTYELVEHNPAAAPIAREVDTYTEIVDPDAELVSRWQAGDASAFEALVRRHERPVFRLALRMLGNREEAEDVTQEALLSLHRHGHSFRARVALLDLRLPRGGQRGAQPAAHARAQPRARAAARRTPERRHRSAVVAARSGRRRGGRASPGPRARGAPGAARPTCASPSCCTTSKACPTARSPACSRCPKGPSSRASTGPATPCASACARS